MPNAVIIPNMRISPQLCPYQNRPIPLPRSWWLTLATVALLLVLAGCRETATAPDTNAGRIQLRDLKSERTQHAARGPAASAKAPAPLAPSNLWPVEPWTYAASLNEFHDIWADRFAISATTTPSGDTLLPYADAVEFQGASWSLQPAAINLLVRRADGNVYRMSGTGHPGVREVEGATPIDLGELLGGVLVNDISEVSTVTHGFEGTALVLIGPILAAESCVSCHTDTPGSVTALHHYAFTEIADD